MMKLTHCKGSTLANSNLKQVLVQLGLTPQYSPPIKKYLQWLAESEIKASPVSLREYAQQLDTQFHKGNISSATKRFHITALYRWFVEMYRQEQGEEGAVQISSDLNDIRKQANKGASAARKASRTDKALTTEELDLIDQEAGDKTRAIFRVLRSTGARISEALDNQLKDGIKMGNHYKVMLRRTKSCNDTGAVYLPADYWEYALNTCKSKKYLLETSTGRRYTRQQAYIQITRVAHKVARKHAEKLGDRAVVLSRLTPHGLRHSLATELLARGVPITAVSEYLGHSSVEVTAHFYAHNTVSPDEILTATACKGV